MDENEIKEALESAIVSSAEQLYPPKEYLFNWKGVDFIHRGDLVNIRGLPKIGRTFAVTTLCEAFLNGTNNELRSRAGNEAKILYFDLSLSLNDTRKVRERVSKVAPGDRFIAFNIEGFSEPDKKKLIEVAIDEYEPTLVIIDWLEDLQYDIQWNENSMIEVVSFLNKLRDKGLIILFTSFYYGDSDKLTREYQDYLEWHSDVVITIERADPNCRRVMTVLARNVKYVYIPFDIVNTSDGLGETNIPALW